MISVKISVTTAEQRLSDLITAAGAVLSGREGELLNEMKDGFIANRSDTATVYVESGYGSAPSSTHGALAPLGSLPFKVLNANQTFIKASAACTVDVFVGSPGPIYSPPARNLVTNVGAGANGVLVTEGGNAIDHQTVIDLNGVGLVVANTSGQSFGGIKIYDFPEGYIRFKSAILKAVTFAVNPLDATPLSLTDGGDFSVGSVIANSASLTTTKSDIIATQDVDPLSGGIALVTNLTAANFDGHTTNMKLFLNGLVDDADVSDAESNTLFTSGILIVNWEFQGDA